MRNRASMKRGVPRPLTSVCPPPYSSHPLFQMKLRYVAGAVEVKDADVVTGNSLLNLWFVASGTTSANGLICAIQLMSVQVWGVSLSGSSSMQEVAVTWLGDRVPYRRIADAGDQFNKPHVSCRPPKESLASFWLNTNTASVQRSNLFSLEAPAGSICDITVRFQIVDPSSVEAGNGLAGAGLSIGAVYFNTYLDNSTTGGAAGTQNWTITDKNQFAAANG